MLYLHVDVDVFPCDILLAALILNEMQASSHLAPFISLQRTQMPRCLLNQSMYRATHIKQKAEGKMTSCGRVRGLYIRKTQKDR